MDNTVLVALLSLCGTLVGSFGGIMAANKLTIYRIEQLEKKVEKHNNVIERVYELERRTDVQEKQLDSAERRLNDLEHRA